MSKDPKFEFVFLDPPSSVDPKTLAFAIGLGAHVGELATKLGLDPTITVETHGKQLRFRIEKKTT